MLKESLEIEEEPEMWFTNPNYFRLIHPKRTTSLLETSGLAATMREDSRRKETRRVTRGMWYYNFDL